MKNTSSEKIFSKRLNLLLTGGIILLFVLNPTSPANSSEKSKIKTESEPSRNLSANLDVEDQLKKEFLKIHGFQNNADSNQKMNVLFIAIDDLNDWVGCMGGNPQVKTPHLDDFNANGGMVMYNAHAPATVCCPSRSAILTGVHAHKTGVYGNKNNLKYAQEAKDLVTLPEYFSSNGYLSLTMGKIFHKHNYTDRENDHGQWAFDEYHNTLPGMGPLSQERPVNGLPNLEDEPLSYHYTAFDWGPTVYNDEKRMLDYKTAQWAADQLQERNFDKPFFMAIGFSKPHLSWYIPQKYFDMYPLEDIVIPENRLDDLDDILDSNGNMAYSPNWAWRRAEMYDRHKEATRAYLAATTFVDDCVGVLLDGLANSKYAENTIVMIWGDHGWYLGEKLRYGKTQLWQEACRVPFMVKVPGITPSNKTCYGVVNLIDMYPTLLDLCNLPENPLNDGRSFVKLLQNPDLEWNEPTLTTNKYKMHRIYDGRYSYIIDENRGTEQLYDHLVDSMEWTNLVYDTQYTEIKAYLKSYLPLTNEPQAPSNDNLPPLNPIDTTKTVWVFPGDSVYAWEYDFFDHLSEEKQFANDTANTIGLYACYDTSGYNIRNYIDANLSEHSAQFKWDTLTQTLKKNGQWLEYSALFSSEVPYQLLLRARKQVDANFRLMIFSLEGDTIFYKDLNLGKDFAELRGGNEYTNWLLSKFPLTQIWGSCKLRFDWYDKVGEPGIFGAFSFIESDLDVTPPEWFYVSVGTISSGTDIIVMVKEDAKIYLVPAGTKPDISSITQAAIAEIEAQAFEQLKISTAGYDGGEYVVYAIDSSSNISEPSRLITIQTPTASPLLHNNADLIINYAPGSALITVKSPTLIRQIDLYNISGEKIKTVNCKVEQYFLKTSDLNPGVYFVQVQDIRGNFKRNKLLIQ